MTAQDVWNLMADLTKKMESVNEQMKATDQKFYQVIEEMRQMRASEKDMREDLAKSEKETRDIIAKIEKESDKRFKKTDRHLNNLGKQLGGLGKKFGLYTEYLAYPSIERILRKKFNVDTIYKNLEIKSGDDQMEIDVLGYANKDENSVYMVEIKSKLNSSELKSTLKNLRRFSQFFPDHKDKALYGIVVAIDYSKQIKQKALDAGLYFSVIENDIFKIDIPAYFTPRRFDR